MADQLNIKGMSLSESQHAPAAGPNGYHTGPQERSAYIPPHARSSGGPRAPAPAANDLNGDAPPAMNGSEGAAWGGAPQA